MLRQLTSKGNKLLDEGYEATCEGSLQRWNCEENGLNLRKRVVVLVDESREAKLAFLWALSHVVNMFDTVTLLYVVDNQKALLPLYVKEVLCSGSGRGRSLEAKGFDLANSFKDIAKAHWPQVHIEVVVVNGDKGPTIISQAKKLEASLLVLGQRRPSLFERFFQRNRDGLVEFCIANADCLTLGVRKQSSRIGGYLINSRWQKNFWLLA